MQQAVHKVAEELGITKTLATTVYYSYWKFIKDTIINLPALNTITQEEFDTLQVNFNIPEIGKLTTNYKKVQQINKHKKIINERIKNKERNSSS